MPLGKTTTSNINMEGKTFNFDPSIVDDQIDAIKKEKDMLRGILEGEYDEFADKNLLQEEIDRLKNAIARRKATVEAYSTNQDYRDLVHAEDPTKVIEGETKTLSGAPKPTAPAAPKARRLTAKEFKELGLPEIPQPIIDKTPRNLKKILKGLGGGIVRGAAQAPALEFVNPPSLGPVEGTPEYDLEMGRITMDEFNKLSRRAAQR